MPRQKQDFRYQASVGCDRRRGGSGRGRGQVHPRVWRLAYIVAFGVLTAFQSGAIAANNHAAGSPSVQIGEDAVPLPVFTPRPEAIADLAHPSLNLSGIWRFASEPPEHFASLDLDDRDWAPIEVPGEWAMQGFTVPAGTAAGYRRRFNVPANWAGMRVKLRCDAVYSDATVWLNGQLAGRHMGGFTPFELDITDLLRPGQENLLAVAVKKESLTDEKFTTFGSKYAAHPMGGISRKITVFAVPAVHLQDLVITTDLDADFRDATLRLAMEVANEGNVATNNAKIRLELHDANGKAVAITPAMVALPAIPPGGAAVQAVDIPVAAPRLWDAEHPNLYTLVCRVEAGGQRPVVVRRQFGFREVEVRGNRMFVNGHAVKLRGVCRHEDYAIRGRSLLPGMWRETVRLFREANVNLIRTSHYPPAEELIAACDELGMFVEEEAPFHHAQFITTPEYRAATLQHTAEMVRRDRSHPSIILWSVGNEAPWSPNFEASAELIRRLDPTRPRLFSHGQYDKYQQMRYGPMEVDSWHYPGPSGPGRAANSPRPVIFDEYCHLNTYNREETVTDPGLRDAWGRKFAAMWEAMVASEGCLGGALWAGIDEVYLLPEREVGWGAWGPIDSWYRPKPEYWHVKKVYSPVRIPNEPLAVPKAGEPIRIPGCQSARLHQPERTDRPVVAGRRNGHGDG